MLKKLLRLPIQLFVFVLFLVIIILGLAQLQIVRDEIRDILVSELNKNLHGQVYIAQVRGNFINYIELSGVALKLDNDYIFKADGATIRLNPFALIDSKIIINEFRLINPHINLKKTESGKWNFELLSISEPDTTPSKSNLSFDLQGIEIINGTLQFNSDPKNNITGGTTFNSSRFNLEALNLSLDFRMNKESKNIEIGHLSFIQDRTNILKELCGKFSLNKSGIKIDTFNLEYNNTSLAMSAFLKDVDIDKDTLSIEKLRNKNIGINLKASGIDIRDIQYFVPQINMLNGNYKINLAAVGTLNNLSVNKLNLQTANSTLNLNGTILNLDKPKDIKFNVNMSESEFDLADLKNNLYPLDLPDYSAAGKVKLNVHYTGRPDDFESEIDIQGNFGRLKGLVNLDTKEKIPKYKLDLIGSALNLQPFLGNSFDSKINCKITGSGCGFNVNETNSEMDIQIDSSRFLNQPIDRSRISATFINKHCNALIAFSGGNTKIGLNTEFNLNKKQDQSYIFNLSINNLDLSKFTNDPNLSSNINVSSSINGQFISIDKTTGQALIYIFPSRFKNDSIPELSINIKYDQSNPEDRRISLYSEIADIELRGLFNIDNIGKNLDKKISALKDNISTTLPFPKQKIIIDTPKKLVKQWLLKKNNIEMEPDSLDIDYSIHLKKPDLIKNYIKCKEINSNIRIDGKLISGKKNFVLSGAANVDNLFYLSSTKNILIQDLYLNYSFSSPVSENVLYNMKNTISLKMPTAYYNKNIFKNVDVKLSTNKNQSDLSVNGNFDTKTDFGIQGKLTLGETEHELEFSKVYLKHANYEWKNRDKIACSIRSDGLDIQSMILSHEDEEILVEGNINREGEQNLSLLINNLRIENVLALASTDTIDKSESFLSGKLNIRGEIFGTATEPLMNLYIRTDSFSTNHKYLGSLFGNIHYEETTLYTNLQFQSSGIDSLRKSDLLLIGTIPINLSMNSSDSLFPDDEEIDMYLVTNKLPLRLASLVMPELENVSGNTDINVHVFGTGNAPEIEGYLTMNKGNFTLKTNGITYITQGRVDITTKDIKMAMSIENLPQDRKDGRIDINGIIKMVDLKLDNIDIQAKGQLQILKKEKRQSNNELYGDLFIATSGDGIKYTQNISSKTGNILTGNILVKDADLVLPLTMSAGGGSSSSNEYKYIVIDDTSKISTDANTIKKLILKQEFEKYVSNKKDLSEPSPMNKLGFRFDVKTLGNAKIEIEMGSALGEALVAEIGGNITLVKSGPNIQIYGTADIGDKSYYKFAQKKFAATGKIIFTGSPETPELSIKATYEGIHVNQENLSNQKDEKVVATINIGGNLSKPNTTYALTVDDKTRDKGDVFGDIISFVLTGKFNDEITSNQKQSLASEYSSSLYSIGSGVISGKLTEFFKNEFEFIRSVETEYSGELTNTNVKIAGEIGKTAIFRFGGKVFSDINNTNINLELPVGKIINNEALRNLILEIYRNTDESTKSPGKEIIPFFGTRIFYRINF
jgi:hypothetical protein